METIFTSILNMSISASWLILAVILLRAILSKAPKGFRYVLWALVAIRLVCPFSIESSFSLVPDLPVIGADADVEKPNTDVTKPGTDVAGPSTGVTTPGTNVSKPDTDVINPGIDDETPSVNNDVNGTVSDALERTWSDVFMESIPWAWATDVVLLLVYIVVTYLILWNKVKVSVPVGENTYICDEIRSPFILGIIKPRIYLPSSITKEQMIYIMSHEKEHLRCLDHIWKPLGFVIVALHWFNPLVWVAYVLMCRDLELACDERVIRNMNAEEKRNYSETLMACSSPRAYISACPVAFGEIGIKERIKRVFSYKKPTIWIVGVAVIACVVIAVCFMTNPKAVVAGEPSTETESESGTGTESESDTETESEMVAESEFESEFDTELESEPESGYNGENIWNSEIGVPDEELTLMQKVLFNKAEFYGTINYYEPVFGWYSVEDLERFDTANQFGVVDLDKDGINEVYVYYSFGNAIIFHEEDGVIYGFADVFRGFNDVCTNGTFKGSAGAATNYYCANVSFNKAEMRYEYILEEGDYNTQTAIYTSATSVLNEKGNYSENEMEVTEEDFNQFLVQFPKSENVVEHQFTIANILKYVD